MNLEPFAPSLAITRGDSAAVAFFLGWQCFRLPWDAFCSNSYFFFPSKLQLRSPANQGIGKYIKLLPSISAFSKDAIFLSQKVKKTQQDRFFLNTEEVNSSYTKYTQFDYSTQNKAHNPVGIRFSNSFWSPHSPFISHRRLERFLELNSQL